MHLSKIMGRASRVQWYLQRLTAMGPAEIAHRVREAYRRLRGRHLGGWSNYLLSDGPLPTICFDDAELLEIAAQSEADWWSLWRAAREGSCQFLGCSWPRETDAGDNEGLNWHLDPVTGTCWPHSLYCFDIPFRHTLAMGDVKYVWELNRLQFLPPLLALARFRQNSEIRDWCLACIEDWIDANPPFLGINWVSGIELAIRSINLILAISLVEPGNIPLTLATKLRAALNAHAVWLARYPSKYSSANNHLIAEASALYILGATMQDLPEARTYREYGWRTLLREIMKQVLPDGVGAEQSPTYTAFTLEWCLMARAVAQSRGDAFPSCIEDRLCKARHYLGWITDRSGGQPRIGDDDEGVIIRSGGSRERNYVMNVAVHLPAPAASCHELAVVTKNQLRNAFLGSGLTALDQPHGLMHFDAGGYSVIRQSVHNRECMLVFDHGPLGYLSIAAHGHADALSIWLHVDGQPVLIDSGTYLYHSGGAARSYFRGTSAHNTLTIEDKDQSTISGPFSWSMKARAKRIVDATDGVEASHQGYKQKFGVVHQRQVHIHLPDEFVIDDTLIGAPVRDSLRARIRFWLSDAVEVISVDGYEFMIMDGARPLISVSFFLGGQRVPAVVVDGMISPRFGAKTRANCLMVELKAAEVVQRSVETRIRVYPRKSTGLGALD